MSAHLCRGVAIINEAGVCTVFTECRTTQEAMDMAWQLREEGVDARSMVGPRDMIMRTIKCRFPV